MQAEELGDFLRRRREALSPAAVGLPVGSGRRTNGLRREEVAVLANIGVSWLTRLEQGRANRVSAEVLGGIAAALRLTVAERTHLFGLAGVRLPATPVGGLAPDRAQKVLVDGLDPNPAYVLDRAWNLVCWNDAEERLFPVLSGLDEAANLLRLTLETESLRPFMTDWEEEVTRLVHQFRLHLTEHPSDEGTALIDGLRAAHPIVAEAWRAHDVALIAPQTRRFEHAAVGELVFDHHRLALPDHPGWLVVIYTPGAGTGTAERFARLAAPG